MFQPLLAPTDFRGRAAEIGAGTGRIVRMLLQAGIEHVVAVEPSDAIAVLERNLADFGDRVTCLHATGEQLPPTADLDYVFSVGVLHHIPEPEPVVRAAYRALRPGGQLAIWLYGKEGNGLYLAVLLSLRWFTQRLPHRCLAVLAWLLSLPLAAYIVLCRLLPLPLRGYATHVLGPMTAAKRRLVIYDQLNPAYAKYYTRADAIQLVEQAGFVDVRIHHRHGYSWSVVGTKPDQASRS